ncbi:hypothetical protein CAPTEDRAFT_224068 [Capitella teleta]|uniref:Serine/threonine-protein kinase Nek4 n=1 Tax=Capitella teleta TaxID=283909 RepID=R7THD3_CAPTE|nr:hypothetical protein CAPTEDRAFT_224068 [Capitella teleta]|eukprot:ELT92847.1 hypothetical protein CAPTEDRAFT_224068 [Capitella teleta]
MSLELYDKKNVIGKGSYGEVWLVRHKRDKKQYVLKKMELLNASKRERKAAEQEAKLLSKLKHPNIVSYKDSFECENGFVYIVMGYCEGGDLYARLKEQKGVPLEERQVVEWFVQITMALQYMHERNILHRDLKTQNIFLTKSKIIKVGDLGIAKVLESSSDMASTLIGTPYYMSPELFSNKPYNYRSDVWALGCCVYEMTTLKHAFNAKDMNSLVYKILRGKMPAMPKSYSPELVSLIKAMMNHNPDKRPSVNRILRDPYIKKNIAIFLEGTRKSRRPSSSRGRPSSSDSRRSKDSHDGGGDPPDSARSSASSVSGVAKAYDKVRQPADEKLDPLNVGPELHPIQEERTPRSNVEPERRSVPDAAKVVKDPPTAILPPDPVVNRKKKRKFLSEAAAKPIVVNIQRSQKTKKNSSEQISKSASDSDVRRLQRDSSASPSRLSASDKSRDHSKSPGRRKESRAPKKHAFDALPRQPKIRGVSPKGPRPLPPRPSSSPAERSSGSQQRDEDKNVDRESGYSSITDSASDPLTANETPRGPNLSARARRRERKESETPRTSRSVDISRKLPSAVDSRPSTAGKDEGDGRKALIRASADAVMSRHETKKPVDGLKKQPSINDDSSSTDEEENVSEERVKSRESKRKEKEMNSFICLLDTTLRMNKEEEKSDSDDDVIIPEPNPPPHKEILVPINEDSDVVDLSRPSHPPQPAPLPPSVNSNAAKTLSTTGRLWERITHLRKDCIRGLGVQKLKKAYDILDKFEADDLEPQLIEVLGKRDFDLYAGKVWQLKFCEEAAFGLM